DRCPREFSGPLHRLLARHTLAAGLHCPLVAVVVPTRICWPLVEATDCSAPLPAQGGCWPLMEVAMLHCSPRSAACHAPLLTMLCCSLFRCSPGRRPLSSLFAGHGVPMLTGHKLTARWPQAHCSLAVAGGCPREEGEHPEFYWSCGTAALVPLAVRCRWPPTVMLQST
ncbi:hypothetical protein Dimus_003610, partial [Dionaea muscipula]